LPCYTKIKTNNGLRTIAKTPVTVPGVTWQFTLPAPCYKQIQ